MALRMEATPESMYCWPQAMSAKGMTMLVAARNIIRFHRSQCSGSRPPRA